MVQYQCHVHHRNEVTEANKHVFSREQFENDIKILTTQVRAIATAHVQLQHVLSWNSVPHPHLPASSVLTMTCKLAIHCCRHGLWKQLLEMQSQVIVT